LGRRLVGAVLTSYVIASLAYGGTAIAEPVFYSLAAGSCALLTAVGQRPSSGWLRAAELVAWNIAFSALLAEAALRAYAAFQATSPLLNDTLDAYRLKPGRDYGDGLVGNQLGYPGSNFVAAKAPGKFRIAALGDSFAVGPAVAFSDNYLTLLQRSSPNIEVYNFGVSAAGPREYLCILRRDVWQFDPDLVLLSIFVGNDITETLATPRHLDPRRSALYLFVTRTWRWARERCQNPGMAGHRLDHPPLSEVAFREIEARRLAVCLDPAPEKLEKKWRRALEYLDQIITDCRSRKVPVAVVLIPDEFQVNSRVYETAQTDGCYDVDDLKIEAPQRRLRAWCAHNEVPCLDLLPYFRDRPDTYALRDTHWNGHGNRLAAEHIADWLAREFTNLVAFSPRRPVQ
jgi:hypothetical protein